MVRCIVIDDEQPARKLIEMHLSGLKDFELVGSFDNPLDAFSFLQKNTIDLIFLDIQMPQISGIDLIKSIKNCPGVILTTAFREYAVEAFELDVVDYLVKPITYERFIKAISKFNYADNSLPGKDKNKDSFDNAYIFLKVNREQRKIFLKDILFIEGLKDYIKVHTTAAIIVAYERLSYMEEKLHENKFARIHKSFIVSVDKISHYTADQVAVGENLLPIGRVYKKDFLKNAKDIYRL